MKRGQAILFFLLGLGLIPLFSLVTPKAQSQDTVAPKGPFMITPAGDDRNTVWRVDQSTGQVSYCVRNITSVDAELIASRPPFCSAWSRN